MIWQQLVEVVLMAHHPVLANATQLLHAEDLSQVLLGSQGNVKVFLLERRVSELAIEVLGEPPLENQVGFLEGLGPARCSSLTKRS